MYIKVVVQPSSKKEELVKQTDTSYVCRVKEKAERNMANMRVREILAHMYNVPIGKVRIISGHRNPKKMISVDIGV